MFLLLDIWVRAVSICWAGARTLCCLEISFTKGINPLPYSISHPRTQSSQRLYQNVSCSWYIHPWTPSIPLRPHELGPYCLPFPCQSGLQISTRIAYYALLTSILHLLWNEAPSSSTFFAQTGSSGLRPMCSGVSQQWPNSLEATSFVIFTLFMET